MIILRIRSLRNEFGLTQEELGKKIGQTKSNISKYETGALEPGIDTLKALAVFFNVSLDYLMGKSDIRNPYNQLPDKFNRSSNNKNTTINLPTEFSTPEEAMKFVLEQNVIMGFGGFDVDKLSDDEVVEFANSLLEHLKLLSLKYKK